MGAWVWRGAAWVRECVRARQLELKRYKVCVCVGVLLNHLRHIINSQPR